MEISTPYNLRNLYELQRLLIDATLMPESSAINSSEELNLLTELTANEASSGLKVSKEPIIERLLVAVPGC